MKCSPPDEAASPASGETAPATESAEEQSEEA